jgi:predicted nucleotidyltransferase
MNIVDKFISRLSDNIELEVIQKLLSKATEMDYSFLTKNEHLGYNICLLGLGGSYAYGTNVPDSDIDIRGIATNSPKELLTNCNFEQVINKETDTTIYSLRK